MNNKPPLVSIGIPVYNGQNFIKEALDSILSQSFKDFEVIISDNASTDGTEEICREYAVKDSRIRYYRHEVNLGPAWNFNQAFKLSTGKYFKWSAHDDLYEPDFLQRCVEVLEKEPSVVLCYCKTKIIDENGNILKDYTYHINTDSPQLQERFRSLIFVNYKRHAAVEIFGLIRAEVLKQTPLIGYYARGDSALLVRLSLLGRFYEVPEYLFYNRSHPQRSVHSGSALTWRGKTKSGQILGIGPFPPTEWFDPAQKGKIVFPEWRILWESLKSVNESKVQGNQLIFCYLYWGYCVVINGVKLIRDILIAAEQKFTVPYENSSHSKLSKELKEKIEVE